MENLNLSLQLITITFLTLHCTAFTLESPLLFAKHYFIPKLFLTERLRSVLSHLFFSIFETLPRWRLLFQNNGNINL